MARQYGEGVSRTDVAKNGVGTLVLNGASQTLVGANANRVALIVSALGAGGAALALGAVPAVAGSGIRLINSTLPFVLQGYTGEVRVIGTNTEVIAFAEI